MFIKVLGSAAGGGFPQWNCNCANCQGLRDGTIQAAPRTQSSIIVSDNGKEWVLCNASPDISQQIAHTPELNKAGVLRGTHIGGIILTDSQIDHTTGLLSLREGCPHQVWCTPEVHEDRSSPGKRFSIIIPIFRTFILNVVIFGILLWHRERQGSTGLAKRALAVRKEIKKKPIRTLSAYCRQG